MNVTDCLLVGLGVRSGSKVQDAAQITFPQAVISSFASVEDASRAGGGAGGELLVLENPDEDSLAKAVSAIDAMALRRWAIVVIGSGSSTPGVETVLGSDLSTPLLGQAFHSAVAQHQLVRTLQQTQGDLRTVAQRISHDMRTPLGGVISGVEVLKESLTEHDLNAAALLTPIFTSADEVSRIVERVSYVLKASINPLAKKKVAMMEPVWAALQRLERQIAQKGALVTQPDSWPEVSGVEKMLEIVWGNLITNALQHSGGTPQIQLGWSKEQGAWKFWVRDNGPGVSALIQGKLFQPFNTLYETNASRGLGLSITQRLVALQGGACGYQPVAGGGSQFFFSLPNT